MMDFNLILLIAGLGLLALVLLFALWGFLGGLKRELSCIAVFIVLLVLSWLVFGDAATFLNAKVGQTVADMLNIKGDSITTLWDAILAYAKTVVPNGEALLVEGKETYSLFYSIVATVCRAAGLVIGTVAILVICPIIRFITHIICLIIRGVKKRKAKKLANENPKEKEEEKKPEEVTVASFEGGEEAVVTKTANELEAKAKGKKRIWGAVAGALKGVFVVILICAPLSGLSSILNRATPETKKLLSNLVSGKTEIKIENSNNVVDMVFDFAEAYENSALGKFANASSFFFKESFSEKMFDKLLTMETKTQTISLSDEIKEFVEAANALEGNVNFARVSEKQFKNAVEALKDSKLTTELMPVAIEYAYEVKSINKLLVEANQTEAFLDLRYNNWRKDIDAVLEAVKEAYDLKLFPIAKFEVLGMNVEELRQVTNILGDTEIMNDALPIGLAVALKLDVVTNTFGALEMPAIDDYDLKKELNSIVDIYAKVQVLDLSSQYKLGSNESIREILGDSSKVNLLFEIVHDVIGLQLVEKLAIPAAFGFLENNQTIRNLFEEAGEFENLMALENEFTLDDLLIYVDAIKIALNLVDLSEYPTIGFNYLGLDPDKLDQVINQLFSTAVTPKVFNMAANVALTLDAVKNFEDGLLTELDFTGFDWEKELRTFVNIYRSFLELGIETEEELKGDLIALLQGVLEDDKKFGALSTIVTSVVDTQIYDLIGNDAIQHFIEKFVDTKFESFAGIINVNNLSKDELKKDLVNVLEMAQIANDLNVLAGINPFDYTQFDLSSDEGIANIKDLISHIFDLNILGDDELKTELLMASINQFDWAIVDEEFDTSKINWETEEQVLLNLVDVYKKINDLEEFDIYNLKGTDYIALLENDLFLDHVVEALEVVVDSNLVLELLPGILDKYVLPKLDDINGVDDETLFNDLFKNLPSEELVNEIIKLVDVLRAAIDMNLLKAKESIGNVDIANTEALKTIISGIFDSKLIQGYEGRIIRIIFKLTGILDIPKDSALYEELINLDYTGEKEVLLAFVDAIEPVLKDSTFKLVNEENKLILDLEFWAEDVNAQTLLEGFKVLFGTYENNDGGSKLIEVLIPNIYDKFIEEKNLIPDNYKEIVDILDVTNATGATIVNDLRCVIYILEQLVAMDVQALLNKGDFEIASDLVVESVDNIIDALHDMQLFKGNESETVAWLVNFAADKLKVEIDEVTTEFDNVDWDGQKEVYKDIVKDIVSLLKDNNLITFNDVVDSIKNKEYNSTTFINKANATAVLNILDKVIDVEVIDAIIPLIVKYGIKLIDEKGFDVSYINDLTSEQLAADFHKFVAIAHTLVEDVDLVSYYVENFKGNMPLPNEAGILKSIDQIFELNIITQADGKLATLIYNTVIEKVVPQGKEFILDISDFSFATIDWSKEKEVIKGLVTVAYDLLEVNNILTMDNIRLMVTEKWYLEPAVLRKETGHVAADAIRVIKDSQILQNVIEKLYYYGIFYVADSNMLPFDISYLSDMTKEMLAQDLGTLADILDLAVDFGVLEYVTDKDIKNINVELLAQMIEKLYDLNLVQSHEVELLTDLLNHGLYLLTNKTSYNFYVTQGQIEELDMRAEFVNIANIVRSLQGFIDANDVDNLNDLLLIVNNASYKNKEFFDKETYSSLINVARTALDLQVVELLLPQMVDFAVYLGDAKGTDLSFLTNGEYTTDLILTDLDTILDIADTAYDFGIIDFVFEKTLYTIETEVLCTILDQVGTLNILNLYFHDILPIAVNAGLKLAKIDVTYEKADFADVVLANDINELKDVVRAVKELLNEKEIVTLNDVNAFIGMGEHKKESCYDVETGKVFEKILTELADVVTVQSLLPKLLNYGVDKVTKLDLSFLKDSFTKEQLAYDIKLVATLIVPAIEAELVSLAFGTKVNDLTLHFDIYSQMLGNIKTSNILNMKWADIVSVLTNQMLTKANSRYRVTRDDFADIKFSDEVVILQETLVEVDDLFELLDASCINDVTPIFKNNNYKDIKYSNKNVVGQVLNVVDELLDAKTIQVILPTVTYHGADFLEYKGIDIQFLFADLAQKELVSDVDSIVLMLKDLVAYGIVEFALHDGEIDIENINPITNAVATIFELNMIKGNEEQTIFLLLDKLKISKDGVDLSTVDWNAESSSLQNILIEAKEILVDQNANQLSEMKAMNFKKYITISQNTNSYIDLFVPILDAVAADQLVEKLTLNVAEKYLAKLNPKYNGLADIHNIYVDGAQLTKDIASVADVLLLVKNLDIYTFLVQNGNYPFGEVETISSIITLVLSLEYFNINDTRVDVIVKALDGLVKLDLSNIDATGVNLRSDAPIIAEIYKDLATKVLTHEKWLVNNKNDLKSFKLHKTLVSDPIVQECVIDSLLRFTDTTIFDKMGAGLVMLAFPVIEKAAPKYYEALDLGNVVVSEVANDLDLFVSVLKEVSELNLVELKDTKEYLTSDVEQVILALIEFMGQSMILDNQGNELADLIFADFVNGKNLAGVAIPAGTFSAYGVNFDHDKQYYNELISEVFTFLDNEQIKTFAQLKTFAQDMKVKSNFDAFLGKYITWESLENITAAIAHLTMVDENGLAVVNNIVAPKLTGVVAELVDFSKYSETEFARDIDSLALLVEQLRDFGIDSVMRNEAINFDQEAVVRAIVNNLANMYFVHHNLDNVIDYVDGKNILPIKLEALKSNEFDYVADADILVDAYAKLIDFMMSEDNTLHTKSEIEAFIKNGMKTGSKLNSGIVNNLYAFVEAYEELVKATIIPVMYVDVFEFVQSKLPVKYQNVINVLDVQGLTFAQKQEDSIKSAEILRTLVDLGLYRIYKDKDLNFAGNAVSTLNGGNVEMSKVDMINLIIEELYNLNTLRNRGEVVLEVLNSLGVETSGIDFTNVDWDNELEAVKMAVSGILSGLLDYELQTVKEVRDYIKSTLTSTSYKALIKSLLKEVKNILKVVNADNFVKVVDALSSSDAFDQIVVPVYNKFLLSRFTGSVYDLLDLTGYTPELLNKDMQIATIMVRDFKVAKELIVETHDNIHNPVCISAVEDFIYQAFLLNVADMKKQDVIVFLDTVKPSLNFDEIDLTDIDMSQEGLIYSQFAEEILVIVFESGYLDINIAHFGNTDIMSAVIDIYNGTVTSSSEIYKEISQWLFSNVIYNVIYKIGNLENYQFTEEKVQLLYEAFGETLDAMLDMGVFSNDGIDFTNKDNTDRLFTIFEDVLVPTGQFATHIRHLRDNIYELGVIPFTYEYLSTSHEISFAKNIIKVVSNFYKEHGIDLRKDISNITNKEVQDDITQLFKELLDSEILEQLLVPGMNGLLKIYTKDVVKLTLLDGVDNYEFINTFLPDMYNILDAVDGLGVLKGKVEYRNADAIVAFAKAVVEAKSTKDHVGDIMKFIFFVVGIDIRDVDFSDVDWQEELESLEAGMAIMKPYLTDLQISNRKSYFNNEFLGAVAQASPYFEDSKVLPLVIRQVVNFANEKVFANKYESYVNRLFDTTYTDEALMHDFAYIDDVIGKIIETGYLETGINYANLYPYVDLLDMFFALEYTNGMEAIILPAIQRRVSVISKYVIDYDKVTDWNDESQKLMDIANAFALLSEKAPFNTLSTSDIQKLEVQALFIDVIRETSESVLGQQLLPLAYEDHFESKLGSDEFQNLIDFDDPNFTPEMWADEFTKIFDAYNLLVANGFGSGTKFTMTLDETIELMEALFGTEADPSLGISAVVKDPKYWVVKMVEYEAIELTDGAEANITGERDWSKEPYKIMAILKAMKAFENAEGKFVYENAYFTTDEAALGTLLLAINESTTIRGSLVQVLDNLMTDVAGVETALFGSGAIDAEFHDELAAYQANKDHYNDEYWTDERILKIAKVIADTNA